MAERHYVGSGLGEMLLWKCPRCGADNTGPLSEGCKSCGSGTAKPRHVELPHGASSGDLRTMETFERWLLKKPPAWMKLRTFLWEAWQAAWQTAGGVVDVTGELGQQEERVVITPHDLLRRVVAKLETLSDITHTETGEYGQSEELRGLIAELRELTE